MLNPMNEFTPEYTLCLKKTRDRFERLKVDKKANLHEN